MILNEILSTDLENCYEALHNDPSLNNMDSQFYELTKGLDSEFFCKLETLFSDYSARTARITYLQGIKDFAELFVILKEDTNTILTEYID